MPLQVSRSGIPAAVFAAIVAVLVTASPGEAKAPVPDDTHIQPGDRLHIFCSGAPEAEPVNGVYRVEPSGKVALGANYGRVTVKGLTLEQAEAAVSGVFKNHLKEPRVLVTRYDPVVHTDDRVKELEARVRLLEEELKALRAAVEKVQK